MKIFMCTDMEGVAGIIDHDNWVTPEGRYYEQGKKLLMREINAAIYGLFEGGATEIDVLDGHGYGGIVPSLLDERARYIRAIGYPWPLGLTDKYDGMCWIGQHAKAGTKFAHIPHTGSMNVIDMSINGISVGEFGQYSMIARELGVKPFFATGDEAFTAEADLLYPGMVTVSVKRGLTGDSGETLDTEAYAAHNLSAIHIHPDRACRMIRDGAYRAMQQLINGLPYSTDALKAPYTKVVQYRSDGKKKSFVTSVRHQKSLIALMNMPEEEIQ